MKKRIDALNNKIRIDKIDRRDLEEWINSEQEEMDEMWDYLDARDKNSFF